MRHFALGVAAAALAVAATGVVPAGPSSASSTAASWQPINTSQPGPVSASAMAFDAATGQLVLYANAPEGGSNTSCPKTYTWTWDGATWMPHQTTTAPPPLTSTAMAYDEATKQVVLFGGSLNTPCMTGSYAGESAETWTWNGSTWALQSAPWPAGQNACAAYDAATSQFVAYGGGQIVPTAGGSWSNMTWEWTGQDWSQLSTPTNPPTGPCAMTYDTVRHVIVMLVDDFSDQPIGQLQTWVWNGSDWMHAADVPTLTSPWPPSIAFDAESGNDVTFIVQTCTTTTTCTDAGQTWSFDGSSWTQLPAANSPNGLSNSPIAYDTATHQLVMYGGPGQTWVYEAAGSSSVTPVRLAGANRQETAVEVSRASFSAAGSASAVVLARDDVFADALAGGPLAAAKDGPLLLTSPNSLDPATATEIQRVLPKGGTVYLLGGTAALSDALAAGVSALGDTPTRIFGSDRFGTAVAIADAMGDPSTVFEASGSDFPDALSAVPAAVATHGAILLTNGGAQDTATAAYVQAHATLRYTVGGPAAWADPTANVALAGSDRYATSQAVALAFFSGASGITAASGTAFPDALAGGPLAGRDGEPVLLVPPTGTLPAPTNAYLRSSAGRVTTALMFGGTAAVSDTVLTELSASLG